MNPDAAIVVYGVIAMFAVFKGTLQSVALWSGRR